MREYKKISGREVIAYVFGPTEHESREITVFQFDPDLLRYQLKLFQKI